MTKGTFTWLEHFVGIWFRYVSLDLILAYLILLPISEHEHTFAGKDIIFPGAKDPIGVVQKELSFAVPLPMLELPSIFHPNHLQMTQVMHKLIRGLVTGLSLIQLSTAMVKVVLPKALVLDQTVLAKRCPGPMPVAIFGTASV